MSRSCGDCQLCCELIQVVPLDKPANTLCQHQCAKGCAIYDDKPDCCTQFSCFWREEIIPELFKPNKVGAVLWPTMIVAQGGGGIGVGQLDIEPGRDRREPGLAGLIEWCISYGSHRVPIGIMQGKTNELYQDGKLVIRWQSDEFISLDITTDKNGDQTMVGRGVKKKTEVLDTPEKLAAWQRDQEATETVKETGKWQDPSDT